jgi:uncharacterized protein (DUF1778 family)
MQTPLKHKRDQFNLRMPAALKQELVEAAERSGQSLANFLLQSGRAAAQQLKLAA